MTSLQAELEKLQAQALALASKDDENSLYMLARLVPNLGADGCRNLLEAFGNSGWFSLPLPLRDFPGLHEFFRKSPAGNGALPILAPRHFEQVLRDEAGRACRHQSELALLILCGPEPDDAAAMNLLADSACHQLGGGDTLGQIDESHFAISVPGGRHFKARALAERILDHYAAELGRTVTGSCQGARAGIACYSSAMPHSNPAQIADLLRVRALEALSMAPDHQVRLYREDNRPASEDQILVQAGEKQFLFFGSLEKS